MSDLERAWAAGFYDGEGHMHWHQGYRTIVITQVDINNLKRFKRAVDDIGVIGGPYKARSHKNCYFTYRTRKNETEKVIALLEHSYRLRKGDSTC